MNLNFSIRHLSTGKIDQLTIEADRVLIGSGAHCDIRLNVDQARIEHVRIDVLPQGVFVTAMSFEPSPTINGVPFTQAPLPPESVLAISQTQIQVHAIGELGASSTVQKKKSSPLTTVLLALLVVALSAMVFLGDNDDRVDVATEAPELWATDVQAQCKQSGQSARSLAFDMLTTAESKRERRAFYPQDGVQAVTDFEMAAACFRAAGEPNSALYCDEAARTLREEMNQDFKKYRERLRYHYRNEEWAAAHFDVQQLLAFTENLQGDYRELLKNVGRDIMIRGGLAAKR